MPISYFSKNEWNKSEFVQQLYYFTKEILVIIIFINYNNFNINFKKISRGYYLENALSLLSNKNL